jgi:hypothetical protein
MFAEMAVIPLLKTALSPGSHWLMSAVFASADVSAMPKILPRVIRGESEIEIHYQGRHWTVIL